ncbi:DUF3300 domain-containing protein [Shigella flexneri]
MQWLYHNPLNKAMLLLRPDPDQPQNASVNSPLPSTIDGVDGRKPATGAKPGRRFLAQPQDVMEEVQRLRQLAQQTGSLKSST